MTKIKTGKVKSVMIRMIAVVLLTAGILATSVFSNPQQVQAATHNGINVATIQRRLNDWLTYNPLFNDHGYLKVDGIYGPGTRQVVVDYQRTHRLAQDGSVGAKTWALLKNEYTNYVYATQQAVNMILLD